MLVEGRFREAVRLQRSILKEPAIYAASENRLAPHRGLPRDVKAPPGASLTGTAASVLEEARLNFAAPTSTALTPQGMSDDFGRLAFFGIFVDQIVWVAREDGSREDPYLIPWDLASTEWSANDRMLIAQTDQGRIPIEHGDGRWLVGQKNSESPWRRGALIALATLWPDMAHARRDRSLNAQSHGDDKWIGNLPEGVSLEDPEAQAMLDEMERLYDLQRAALFSHGATVRRDQSTSQNWQIFKELLESDDKWAQKILLGQDGTMTNTGGNYVKAWGLFGVRNDIIESDLSAVGVAYATGLVRCWSILNFGRWDRLGYAWLMPDADEDARRESMSARMDAFNRAVKEARENGFVVDQGFVESLAEAYGVKAPTLADKTPTGTEIFAYELEGGTVTINEARERKGLPPVPWGETTLPERQAKIASEQAPAVAPAPTDAAPPTLAIHRRPLRGV